MAYRSCVAQVVQWSLTNPWGWCCLVSDSRIVDECLHQSKTRTSKILLGRVSAPYLNLACRCRSKRRWSGASRRCERPACPCRAARSCSSRSCTCRWTGARCARVVAIPLEPPSVITLTLTDCRSCLCDHLDAALVSRSNAPNSKMNTGACDRNGCSSNVPAQVFTGDAGDHDAFAAFDNWRSLPIQTWLGGSACRLPSSCAVLNCLHEAYGSLSIASFAGYNSIVLFATVCVMHRAV